MWKVKNRNKHYQKKYLTSLSSSNFDYKNIEEVYKLNFSTQNLSHKNIIKKEEIRNSILNKKIPNLIEMNKSIERIKKFLPNVSEINNLTKENNHEKYLIKRLENQETEKIMKEDLNQVNNKRNKIKKSISDNLLTFQKLDKNISEIKLSLYVHSKMAGKPIILSPSKKSEIKNFLYDQRISFENDIGNKQNIHMYKNNKKKEMKSDHQRRLKILKERLIKKEEEIQEMKRLLPKIEINKKETLSKLKSLEKEKKDLKDIKNNISEKLYFHYLNILKEGIDTRNQGFSSLLQEIINLDKRILLSYFPDYLDYDSIKYLLKQAKLKLKLQEESNKIKKLKNYFSEAILIKKNKKIQKKEEEINNVNEVKEKSLILNYPSNKNWRKTERNKFYNSFWDSNEFSKIDSTTKTTFSNINFEKNLSRNEINFNNNEKDGIIVKTNNYKNNNNMNFTNLDLKFDSDKPDKQLFKTKTKNKFYKKLLLNHGFSSNSPSSEKKIDLSNYYLIPNKLSLNQVERYLNSKKKKIPKLNTNKVSQYFELDKKIKKINNRLKENKKIEIKRIFDKYLKMEDTQKNNLEKEKVLAALIGEDNVQTELRKQKIN